MPSPDPNLPYSYPSPESIDRARELRSSASVPEQILWKRLRNRQLSGLKFRRQQPLGVYTIDFYCAELQLAIEIDGIDHNRRVDADAARDAWIMQQGVRVVRIPASDVIRDVAAVLDAILRAADAARPYPTAGEEPSPYPLPEGEGASA
jgi:very-short-patch-repair endonuclease